MSDLITVGTTVFAENERWDGPGPWWPIFPILWLLVLAGIGYAIVRFARRRDGTNAGESRLAERFASGEIGEQEYSERLTVLREKKR